MCHDHHKCPTKKEDQEEEKVYRDITLGKHDVRSSSCKGVVINGAMEVKDKDNGKISYHGKREENMYEKRKSKWSRVADKDSRVSTDRRNKFGGEDGVSYHTSSRHVTSRDSRQ